MAAPGTACIHAWRWRRTSRALSRIGESYAGIHAGSPYHGRRGKGSSSLSSTARCRNIITALWTRGIGSTQIPVHWWGPGDRDMTLILTVDDDKVDDVVVLGDATAPAGRSSCRPSFSRPTRGRLPSLRPPAGSDRSSSRT